jgi:hypothetical protein
MGTSSGSLTVVGPAHVTPAVPQLNRNRVSSPLDRVKKAEGRIQQHSTGRLEGTAMIIGAHSIIYSANPDADRAFLRDVLKLTHVDVGGGWLIFGLPPAEVAVHPSDKHSVQELYLMCDDVSRFIADMRRHHITCEPVTDQPWGLLTYIVLPGGGKLGLYQPKHARPRTAPATPPVKRRATKARVA